MSQRSVWTGAVSFGLVSVPVKAYKAHTAKDVHFNQLHAADDGRINMKRHCSVCEVEVPYEDIVKGYEVAPGKYVKVGPEELEALLPEATRSITIESFVDEADLDPLCYDAVYWLKPEVAGARAYHLLRAVMRQEGCVAVGKVVMRSKEYLCAVRPHGNALILSTMYFADELAKQDLEPGQEATTEEMNLASALVRALRTTFNHEEYKDEYRAKVLDLLGRKARGEVVEVPKPEAKKPAADIQAALKASIQAAAAAAKKHPKTAAEALHKPTKKAAKKSH